jgi:hypothetical protein
MMLNNGNWTEGSSKSKTRTRLRHSGPRAASLPLSRLPAVLFVPRSAGGSSSAPNDNSPALWRFLTPRYHIGTGAKEAQCDVGSTDGI